jgi:bifunctional non-homologous end joining protein LigD
MLFTSPQSFFRTFAIYKVHLRSCNDQAFNGRYTEVAKALAGMPDETVIDGEIVALDSAGRPSFNTLQNYGSAKAPVFYYVFDLMVLAGKDVMAETLDRHRELLEYNADEDEGTGPLLPGTQRAHGGSGPVRQGTRARRSRHQTSGQPVRAGRALRCVAENAH